MVRAGLQAPLGTDPLPGERLEEAKGGGGGLPPEWGGGTTGRPGRREGDAGVVREVREYEGTAYLMRGPLVGDDEVLVEAFNTARDDEYSEIVDRCRDLHAELKKEREAKKFTFAELEENEEDLAKLEAWFGKVRARDRFGAPLVGDAERAIGACQQDLEDFARSVYKAADHDSAGTGGP